MRFTYFCFFYLLTHIILIWSGLSLGKEIYFLFKYRIRETNTFRFSILLDYLSVWFLSFVALITFSVVLYRKAYIGDDRIAKRFIILVSLFVISIFILISSPRFLMIMLGWDGLGVTSFLLVIYYNNVRRLNSGLVTIYLNRLGDFLIVLSFFILFGYSIFDGCHFFITKMWLIVYRMILLARITKRAQLPFSSWLPAAIAAPTPVSSLVHSSTLVTAGVYVILRFFYLTEEGGLSRLLLIISLLTCFGAGVIACYENDLKKLVAISTLSQLGLIIFSYSLGEDFYSFFHMVCHALFKALLFLSCGFVIINVYGLQDSRLTLKWGALFSRNYFTIRVAVFRLIGFPFLTGFFSKDSIIETCLGASPVLLIYAILFISCILTGIYGLKGLILISSSQRKSVGFYRGNITSTVFLGILLLALWSVTLGKTLGMILGKADFPLILSLLKIGGLAIVSIGGLIAFLYGWTKILSLSLKGFFGNILFLNWVYGGFRRRSLERMILSSIGELSWLQYLGVNRLNTFIIQGSNYAPFFLGGVKISFVGIVLFTFRSSL